MTTTTPVTSLPTLPLLTTSAAKSYRSCPRKYELAYERGYRPLRADEALRFGTLLHVGLEAWYCAAKFGSEQQPHVTAIEAMRARVASTADDDGEPLLDEVELLRAEVLIAGYSARYEAEFFGAGAARRYEVIAVEAEFQGPLVNPVTHADSRTWRLGGKIDAIVRSLENGHVYVVEHKTSSEDLTAGSDYWARLTLDPQISNYLVGARLLAAELGYAPSDVAGVIYDVIAKPAQRPLQATPEEVRKYTKPTAKDPVSRLYANQRERDETLDEYADRLVGALFADPDRYYARREIVRLEADVREAAIDLWQVGTQIRDARRLHVFPRNADACLRFGRRCSYFDVCLGLASVDDPARFRRAEREHEELSESIPTPSLATTAA